MTALLSVVTLGEGLTLLTQVIGFGVAAYKFGRWNQSIEDQFARHEERFARQDVRLKKHRSVLLSLLKRLAGGPAA